MDLAFDAAWENDTLIDDRPTSPTLPASDEEAKPQGSYVGALPEEPVEDLAERRHRALVQEWSELRDRAGEIESWDASVQAAAAVMGARVAEIAQAAAQLVRVSAAARAPESAAAFAEDGPLAAYLAGAYLWLDGVVPSLSALSAQLAAGQPDWSLFRQRLDDLAWLFEATEREQMSIDWATLPATLASDARAMVAAVDAVKAGVAQPFG